MFDGADEILLFAMAKAQIYPDIDSVLDVTLFQMNDLLRTSVDVKLIPVGIFICSRKLSMFCVDPDRSILGVLRI